MRTFFVAVIASVLLAACGGGDSQTNATRLGSNIVTAVQVGVSHPAGGFALDPSNPENCPDLYAFGEFTSSPGPFPADVAMPLVEVYQGDALLWSGSVRSDVGLLSNGNLHAVAAACGITPLPGEGTLLTIRFVLIGGGATTSIVTSPIPVQYVY